MIKSFVLLASLATVAGLGLSIDRQSDAPARRAPSPQMVNRFYAAGSVEGASPQAELRLQLSGRVVEVLCVEGQVVVAGEVLLRLQDDEHRQQVALAAAEVEQQQAQLERLLNGAHQQRRIEAKALYQAKRAELRRARLSWQRIEQLGRDGAVSQQEADDEAAKAESLTAQLEAAKARVELLESPARPDEVRVAKARITAAKAQRDLAQVLLGRTRLVAPRDGRILKINVEPGELTGPASSQPAIVMADLSTIHIRAFVEELDAPRVALGMSAEATADGLPDRVFKGRVTKISPRMARKQLFTDDPSEYVDTKTREIWIELEDASELVYNLRVDVVIDATSQTPTRK